MRNSSMAVPNPKAHRKTINTFKFWTKQFKIRITPDEKEQVLKDLLLIAEMDTIVPAHFGVLNTLFKLRPKRFNEFRKIADRLLTKTNRKKSKPRKTYYDSSDEEPYSILLGEDYSR